jgi:hypothetical protein
LSRYDYNNTILVLVGAEETPFTIHKDIISVKSKFFQAVCSERWKEGQEKTVRLPDVEPKIFGRYVDWAYGDVFVAEEKGGRAIIATVIKLYLVGDVLEDVKLRNKAIRALTSYAVIENVSVNCSDINLIWDRTTPTSSLRRWVLENQVLRLNRLHFEQLLEKYPAEYLQQLALKLMQQTPTERRKVLQAKLAECLEVEDSV